MASAYDIAKQFSGQHESNKSDLLNRFLNGDTDGMTSAEFAWCSRFAKQAALKAGVPAEALSKVNDMAKSWLNAGTPTKTPNSGDIVVMSRGDPNGPYGHVGFYEGQGSRPGTIKVFAGNQGDAVKSAEYPLSRVLGYRNLGAFSSGDASGQPAPDASIPPILQSGYGRESGPAFASAETPAPPAAPDAASAPGPIANLQSWAAKPLFKTPEFMGGKGITPLSIGKGLQSIVGGMGGGDQEKAAQQLTQSAIQANSQALASEDQKQAQILQSMMARRKQRGAFA